MKVAFLSNIYENIGLEYLSAVLKKEGHTTRLFIDPQLFNDAYTSIKPLARIFAYDEIVLSQLQAYGPQLVCFSVLTDFYPWVCYFAKCIKERINVPIIAGGIHASSVPEQVINNECIDMVCIGEGEMPLLEVVNNMEKGKIDYSIANIWFKSNGDIIKNDIRPLVEQLDSLPLPDKDLYYNVSGHFSECYYISIARGCPHACSYCCHSFLKKLYKNRGTYYRQRSLDSVMRELVFAKEKYNIKLIRFMDDCFPVNLEWLKEFKMKYKHYVNVPFLCYCYPYKMTDETFQLLEESGCREIYMGVQSWSEKIRHALLGRHEKNKEVADIIHISQKSNINLVVDLIWKLPEENHEDIFDFFILCRQKKLKYLYVNWLKYYPKVSLTEHMKKKYDRILKNQDRREKYTIGKSFTQGGDVEDYDKRKLFLFLLICKFLPIKIAKYFYKRKWHAYLPGFIPLRILVWMWDLTTKTHEQQYISKMEWRYYKKYILEIIKRKILFINK